MPENGGRSKVGRETEVFDIREQLRATMLDNDLWPSGTEITFSLNAGHQAALESIADSGDVLGKEWLAIGDDSTRETHLAAHGQIVAVKTNFTVGGYECWYPGDVTLPAQERTNCHCTIVATINV